jgi:hypothetical protein
MKKISTYYLIAIVFILSSYVFQDGIIGALKTGDAAQLSKLFDNTINISIADKKNTYSKSQAELVLKDFFNNNTVKGFEKVHDGDKANPQFIIGILETKNGEYRTTIYMKQKEGKNLLQELRFEK